MDDQTKIRLLMKINRLSGRKLAELSGVPASTINSFLRLNNVPTHTTLTAICSVFGMTLEQFIFFEYIPPDMPPGIVAILKRSRRLSLHDQEKLISIIDIMFFDGEFIDEDDS